MKSPIIMALAIAPAALFAQTFTQTLTVSALSNIDMEVGGLIGSSSSNPLVTGSVSADLTFTTGMLTGFTINSGRFFIADQNYPISGGQLDGVIADGTNLSFEVLASILTVGAGTGPGNYTLSDALNLEMDTGTVVFPGFGTADFGEAPVTINPVLTLSEIDVVGTTATNVVLKFGNQEVYNVGPGLATLSVSSLDTIELEAVPEPSSYGAILGVFAVVAALARRRARQ